MLVGAHHGEEIRWAHGQQGNDDRNEAEGIQREAHLCACHSDEHTLKFGYDPEDNELYTSVFLNHYQNVFKRVWIALKYVFGYKCKYGHWDCFIMRAEDGERLKSLLDRLIQGAKTGSHSPERSGTAH